ncbi:MAG: type II toxin-antitoxin system HicA family toxin [Bacteroidales bacterium]|jgi:predicted RNA binding protein YcfA (HicA-like mRNA interferase family)|nr:type II toxin-antitoxin system HicA family toxin [Bacteroidales bacterium]
MKRLLLLKHLHNHNCVLRREGGSHSLKDTGAISAIPRHPDVKEGTVKAICKQLGIPHI